MKDKQPVAKSPSGSIPIISPVLHCLSMPVLVFFRRSFGYSYLSPKSIFLSLAFASALFAYAVWHDKALKPSYSLLATFFSLASLLYIIHLILAIARQTRGNAEHDQYSGTSHLLGFVALDRRAKYEGFIHGLVEPALAIVAGILLGANLLGKVFVLSGIALAFKELIRAWLALRHRKRMEDSLDDAKETMEAAQPAITHDQPLSSTGRTSRERFQRKFEAAEDRSAEQEIEHAKELRLMPPYSLDKAEENFASLSKLTASPQEKERLDQAIVFFRSHLR